MDTALLHVGGQTPFVDILEIEESTSVRGVHIGHSDLLLVQYLVLNCVAGLADPAHDLLRPYRVISAVEIRTSVCQGPLSDVALASDTRGCI